MQTNALLRSKSRAVVTLNSFMTLYSWLVNTTTNISVDCVVPENIHTPPPPYKGIKNKINLPNFKHKMNIFVLLDSIFCRR